MSLLVSLRSETLKSKRTASFYLTLAAATFGPFMSMLDLVLDGIEPGVRNMIFPIMLTDKFEITGVAMLPIFMIMICTLLPQIEYRNYTWKQVLSSPQSKADVFLAKFVNVQSLIILFLLTNFVMMFVAAVILHFMHPSLDVLNQPVNGIDVLMTRVNSYVSLLALCSIQFWLGLRLKNFIAPIAIGMALWLTGTILVMQNQSGIAEFFPYSYHVFGNIEQSKPETNTYQWMSVGYSVLFLVIGYLDFRKRRTG